MRLPEISSRIKRLATLDMPVEALKVLLLDLAVELDQVEARLSLERARKRPGKSKEVSGNSGEIPRKTPDIPASRVEDNISEPSLLVEEVKEKGNLSVSQKAPSSKPLPPEPKGFVEFFEIYPRRAGGNARPAALKSFKAQINRGVPFETIMEGVRRYRAHCDAEGKTGTQFVFKARTWLNDQSWNETYETTAHRGHNGKTSRADAFAILDAVTDEAIRREGRGPDCDEENTIELSGLRQSAA